MLRCAILNFGGSVQRGFGLVGFGAAVLVVAMLLLTGANLLVLFVDIFC
jgi:hypothetical protein